MAHRIKFIYLLNIFDIIAIQMNIFLSENLSIEWETNFPSKKKRYFPWTKRKRGNPKLIITNKQTNEYGT